MRVRFKDLETRSMVGKSVINEVRFCEARRKDFVACFMILTANGTFSESVMVNSKG